MNLSRISGRRFAVAGALLAAIGIIRWWHASSDAPAHEPLWRHPPPSGSFRDVAPRWSHDGSRIAFLREWETGHVQLCVAPADLSRVHVLTRPEVVNPDIPLSTGRAGVISPDGPAWSPDNREVAFPRGCWFGLPNGTTLPGTGLWAADTVSGAIRPLALHRSEYRQRLYTYRYPAWSRDGRYLAFVAHGALNRTRIGIALTHGRYSPVERADTFNASDWSSWDPQSRRLALAQGIVRGSNAGRVATIRVIEIGGREARQAAVFTPDGYRHLCPRDAERNPNTTVQPYVAGLRWTDDGRNILFTLTPDPLDIRRCSVWSVSAGTPGALTRISPDDGYGYFAPHPVADAVVGAGRMRAGGFEAVLISSDRRVLEARRLPSDDWDWSSDGSALVCAGESIRDPEKTGLSVIRFAAVATRRRLR